MRIDHGSRGKMDIVGGCSRAKAALACEMPGLQYDIQRQNRQIQQSGHYLLQSHYLCHCGSICLGVYQDAISIGAVTAMQGGLVEWDGVEYVLNYDDFPA
jgi:hypothetical protein